MLGVAHRGGNEVVAAQEAARLGADIVEADVHLYRGRLEIRHEKSLGPAPWLYDKKRFYPRDLSRPLLDDLLDAVPTDATLMLDLKGVGQVGAATAAAVLARTSNPTLMVCARWWPSVRPFLEMPDVKVLLSARGRGELTRLRHRIRTAPPDGVSIHLSMLSRGIVAEIHERVPLILSWPVDDAESLREAERLGVDGVITKDLEILRQVVQRA